MNGRLYDPIVGRMLNPDNFYSRFIGNATSTQAYNRYSYVVNNPLKYTDPSGWIRNYITYDDILGHQSLMEGLAQVQAGMEWMMGSRRGFGGSFTYEWTYRTHISDADQKAADESWLKYGIALSPPYTIEFYQKPIYQPSGLQFTQPFAMGMANVVAPTGDMAAMGGGGSGADYIEYDGTTLRWYSNNKLISVYHATSGYGDFQNSKYQDKKDFGPIPEGTYKVNLALSPDRTAEIITNTGELAPGFGIQNIPESYKLRGYTIYYGNWGTLRARLEPISGNQFGRDNFYLHNSHKGQSKGCIEVGKSLVNLPGNSNDFFTRLMQFGKENTSIIIIVNYLTNDTSTNGNTQFNEF